MAQYRRKPEEVTAIQYDGTNAEAIVELLGGETNARTEAANLPGPGRGLTPGIRIQTFAKQAQAREGDWVARTDAGFKVISNVQFSAEYEAVTD